MGLMLPIFVSFASLDVGLSCPGQHIGGGRASDAPALEHPLHQSRADGCALLPYFFPRGLALLWVIVSI